MHNSVRGSCIPACDTPIGEVLFDSELSGNVHLIVTSRHHSRLMFSARPADVIDGRSSMIKSWSSRVIPQRGKKHGMSPCVNVSSDSAIDDLNRLETHQVFPSAPF